MKHPFAELASEYEQWVVAVKPLPDKVALIDQVARRLTDAVALDRLNRVTKATGIPEVVQACIGERECGFDFTKNWGQGDPLTRPSIHVPKGRPPLGEPPNDHWPVTWEYAAIDVFTVCDRLDVLSVPEWTLPYACWKFEGYNGFGYRAHGRRSPYVVGGTNLQQPGKYIADGVWDPDHVDAQLGCLPIAMRMIELVPSLSFGAAVARTTATELPAVSAPPLGMGGNPAGEDGVWQTDEIQRALKRLGLYEGFIDGSYGRLTRAAVRAFQEQHGLTVDGLAGTRETLPALAAAVSNDA